MRELDARIDRWVEAGVISSATGEDLRRFEAAHADADSPPSLDAEPSPTPPAPPRALALVGEVVGYLGAALVVSAVSFLVSRTWGDLPTAGRIGLVGALLAVVAVGGTLASRPPSAPAQRLASVLLAATVGLSAWFAWVVIDAATLSDDLEAPLVSGIALAVAATVYVLRRRALAQLALLVALCVFVSLTLAAALEPREELISLVIGLAIAAIGLAWVGLSATRRLEPARLALVTGGLVAVFGLQAGSFEEGRWWMLALAVALSVAMIVIAITRSPLTLLIVPGGLGMLIAVPRLIERLVGDALATWVAVMVTGVALVVAAVMMVRERGRPRTP